jgi:hypothetical protein
LESVINSLKEILALTPEDGNGQLINREAMKKAWMRLSIGLHREVRNDDVDQQNAVLRQSIKDLGTFEQYQLKNCGLLKKNLLAAIPIPEVAARCGALVDQVAGCAAQECATEEYQNYSAWIQSAAHYFRNFIEAANDKSVDDKSVDRRCLVGLLRDATDVVESTLATKRAEGPNSNEVTAILNKIIQDVVSAANLDSAVEPDDDVAVIKKALLKIRDLLNKEILARGGDFDLAAAQKVASQLTIAALLLEAWEDSDLNNTTASKFQLTPDIWTRDFRTGFAEQFGVDFDASTRKVMPLLNQKAHNIVRNNVWLKEPIVARPIAESEKAEKLEKSYKWLLAEKFQSNFKELLAGSQKGSLQNECRDFLKKLGACSSVEQWLHAFKSSNFANSLNQSQQEKWRLSLEEFQDDVAFVSSISNHIDAQTFLDNFERQSFVKISVEGVASDGTYVFPTPSTQSEGRSSLVQWRAFYHFMGKEEALRLSAYFSQTAAAGDFGVLDTMAQAKELSPFTLGDGRCLSLPAGGNNLQMHVTFKRSSAGNYEMRRELHYLNIKYLFDLLAMESDDPEAMRLSLDDQKSFVSTRTDYTLTIDAEGKQKLEMTSPFSERHRFVEHRQAV